MSFLPNRISVVFMRFNMRHVYSPVPTICRLFGSARLSMATDYFSRINMVSKERFMRLLTNNGLEFDVSGSAFKMSLFIHQISLL
jgi:hypothetical protein